MGPGSWCCGHDTHGFHGLQCLAETMMVLICSVLVQCWSQPGSIKLVTSLWNGILPSDNLNFLHLNHLKTFLLQQSIPKTIQRKNLTQREWMNDEWNIFFCFLLSHLMSVILTIFPGLRLVSLVAWLTANGSEECGLDVAQPALLLSSSSWSCLHSSIPDTVTGSVTSSCLVELATE